MKILFQYIYGSGGALTNLVTLLQAFATRYPQNEIVILCAPGSQFERLSTLDNVEIEHYGGNGNRIFNRIALGIKGMAAAVERHGPDVVWTVNTGSFVPVGCAQVLQLNNAYQVYPLSFAQFHPRGKIGVALLSWLFRISAMHAEMIVCQTETIAGMARKVVGRRRKVRVIGKAVHANIPDHKARHLRDNRSVKASFAFGYVAAFYPHKNHITLLKAIDNLRRQESRVCLHLTLTRNEILALDGELGRSLLADGTVVAHGWVDQDELAKFYSEVDACVMPSLLESLSSSHIEAMALGVPQITSDLSFARETCGDAAIYADPQDPDSWSVAMKRIVEDRALANRLGRAGAARIHAMPNAWEDIAAQWSAVLIEARNDFQRR